MRRLRTRKSLVLLGLAVVVFATLVPALSSSLPAVILTPLWIVVSAVAIAVIRRTAARCDDQPVALLSLPLVRAARARELRGRAGGSPESIRAAFFALARDASRRVLGLRPFDVQVLAAIALDRGHIVEMQTGEGKTLAAVMPAALRALTGQGAHVLTFNDYLARRDAEWMGPLYAMLGLSVGFVQQGMTPEERG